MAATADRSKPFIPLSGVAEDGWSKEDEATATCFCGAVQLVFVSPPALFVHLHLLLSSNTHQPTHGPGLVRAFVCNCYDCRKLTASMFASNVTIQDPYLRYVRGRDNLTVYSQAKTTTSGKAMTNYFCKTCGTLMNRIADAFPGRNFIRLGTVDDFTLHETKLRPTVELFTKDRVSWFAGVPGGNVTAIKGSGTK